MESRQGGLGNPVLIGAWAEFASQPCFDLFPYVTQPEHSCFRWLRRTAKVFPHLFHFCGKGSSTLNFGGLLAALTSGQIRSGENRLRSFGNLSLSQQRVF